MTVSKEHRKEYYAAHATTERIRKRELANARAVAAGKAEPLYDLEDYVEEFGELTALGMSCREIVDRSVPSLSWFRNNVFPRVGKALCITCRRYFDPGTLERGTECDMLCSNAYTGFGRRP